MPEAPARPSPRCCRSAAPALVAVAALLPAAAPAADFRADGDPVAVAVYDFEVASLCGLVSKQVLRGFRLHLERLVERAGLTREAFEEARMRGWTAADREWANRGLGGFRGWCRGEGAAAAAAFARHAPRAGP